MQKQPKKYQGFVLGLVTLLVIGLGIILPVWLIYIFEKIMLFQYLGLNPVADSKLVQGFIGSLLVGWGCVYLQEWWLSYHPATKSKGPLLTLLRIGLTYPFFVVYVYLIWQHLNWGQNLGLIAVAAAIVTFGWCLSRFPEWIVKHKQQS